jgi:hypothetical protein
MGEGVLEFVATFLGDASRGTRDIIATGTSDAFSADESSTGASLALRADSGERLLRNLSVNILPLGENQCLPNCADGRAGSAGGVLTYADHGAGPSLETHDRAALGHNRGTWARDTHFGNSAAREHLSSRYLSYIYYAQKWTFC